MKSVGQMLVGIVQQSVTPALVSYLEDVKRVVLVTNCYLFSVQYTFTHLQFTVCSSHTCRFCSQSFFHKFGNFVNFLGHFWQKNALIHPNYIITVLFHHYIITVLMSKTVLECV